MPKEKYALANGILASLYFSGSSIGLILGGSIVHFFDWRLTFFSLLPFLGILYFVTIKFLKVEGEEQKQIEETDKTTEFTNLKSSSNSIDTNKDKNIEEKEPNRFYSYLPKKDKLIDIKGALTLASTITFSLIALSYLEIGEKDYATIN